MSALNWWVSSAWLRATGFALLHSLWQGAVLGLLVALLLGVLRREAALARYRVAALGLVTLVALAGATFGYYYTATSLPGAGTGRGSAPALPLALAHHLPGNGAAPGGWPSLLSRASQYLEQHLAVVVGLWLLGFGVMALRLLVAAAYVRRLRRAGLGPVPAAWQQRLDQLALRGGLTRAVRLLTSSLVSSPLVIGYFAPVILLPLGMLGSLDPAAVEMLLAHELAHIIRRDYLFNALQAVAETVFFYHPAVWFLSGVLHEEREHCCDDLATQLGGSSRQLAHALAALAELTYAGAAPRLTLTATGGAPGALLHRVRRLAQHRPVKAPFWPSGLALVGAGLLLCVLLLTTGPAQSLSETRVRTRRASTTKSRPDDAPRTGRPPLALSDNALQALFRQQLCADGLLKDTTRYRLTLTATQLLVNGQPQADAFLAPYQRLYEAATGYRMTATTTYTTEEEIVHTTSRSLHYASSL